MTDITHDDTAVDGQEVVDLLEHLATTAEDGAKGFQQAADLVAIETVASTLRELGYERQRFAHELRAIAATNFGEFVPATGSVKAAVHRGWMALKDLITGSDPHAVIAAAEEGEDYALEQWNDAAQQTLPIGVAQLVSRQRDAVQAAHDKVRDLEIATE